MAKRTLATDFKDDILAESMDGKRRYRFVANGDGTYCFEDASVYEQTGSIYGAKQVNEANEAINSAADSAKIIDDIDAVLANTVGGYMAGAMAVRGLYGKLKAVAKTVILRTSPPFHQAQQQIMLLLIMTQQTVPQALLRQGLYTNMEQKLTIFRKRSKKDSRMEPE